MHAYGMVVDEVTFAPLMKVILSSVWDQEHGQNQNTKENRPEVPPVTAEKTITNKGKCTSVAKAKPAQESGGLEKKKKKASANIVPQTKKQAATVSKKASKHKADDVGV